MVSGNDNEDLEALFDQIASSNNGKSSSESVKDGIDSSASNNTLSDKEIINRIGHLTRVLHDTLRSLGLEAGVEKAAADIPDVRARLEYVANLTKQAANKVLDATDKIDPHLSSLSSDAKSLSSQWDAVLSSNFDREKFKALVFDTRRHLNDEQVQIKAIGSASMDIVMAQDFQDLTGQVLKKVSVIIHEVETQLLTLLMEHAQSTPTGRIKNDSELGGPVIHSEGRSDVVANQDQVDDLLASLGF